VVPNEDGSFHTDSPSSPAGKSLMLSPQLNESTDCYPPVRSRWLHPGQQQGRR
jgi:hypothetical protein